MNKKTLKEIADRYGTDKGQLKHNYTITYSKLDGSNTQVALSDGPTPAADTPKIFSICQ